MSEDSQADTCCASCGIAEIDDIKLVPCDGCDLVRYCGDECRSEHEEDRKRRAAELRDKLLFKQPESSHMGDCPICFVPLSLDLSNSTLMPCCSNVICHGCEYANWMRENQKSLAFPCPFCREPAPETEEESDKRLMKRVEANDPVAICQQGFNEYNKGEYSSAIEYWTKAADLGYAEAHYQLADLCRDVEGVEKKDVRKEIYHLEEAAIGGHPKARNNLGCIEGSNGNIERAVKHWIIAATQGDDHATEALMEGFRKGLVKKEDLASALRSHQAAVDATKSPQRKAAEDWSRMKKETQG